MHKLLLLIGLLLPAMGWALPDEFVQEGLVFTDDGEPFDGAHDITVRLYANEQGGEPLFEEAHEGVAFFDGYYAVSIGSIEELTASTILRPTLYLGISIDDGRELQPRTPIVKVPAAFTANVADNAIGDITPRTVSIGDAMVIDENGRWVGDPTGLRGPPGPPGEAGDIDDVIAAILAALEEDPSLLPFLRKDTDDAVTDATTTFRNSRLVFDFRGVANAIDLDNNNLVGANSLRINDPGPNEGILWTGTQASIVVSTLGGGNSDGYLRLINDEGISLESNTRVAGNLTITGAIDSVQSITTTVLTAQTANITNANITNLNGPGNRINVLGELNLSGDVRISDNTDFIGTIRTGGLLTGGDIRGRNIAATASISAAGNLTAGNRLIAGNGGIWVGDVQIYDGNGNLVRHPVYRCPNGQVMRGASNGRAECVALLCPVGQYLRGLDGNNRPICVADGGIRSIPQRTCPPGQAATAISANGTITCGVPRAQPQRCDEGEFVVGLNANGSVICDDAPEGGGGAGGQCEPDEVRPNIMICGSNRRNMNEFVLPGFRFNFINSCDPNDQTQAMFVTRGGGNNAAGRAAAWQAYVRAGGNIITEYNISHLVWNAVFGTNIGRGAGRRGSCRDNPMPVVKVNLEDDFWQLNDDIAVTPANQAACGYEVGAYPGITPLGGWSANQIMVGYRDLGAGRVWANDSDWQDGQAITAGSRTFMGRLMTWCGGAGDDDDDDDGEGLEFEGVRNNVPPGEIQGWRQCHRSLYGQRGASIAEILRECDGDQIMYGCKQVNAANWQVLAQGEREAVFRDTGRGNAPTINNGVAWYFNDSYSLGFAPAGQAISRNSCDTQNGLAAQRICWHSGGGTMNGGWRCGANTGLNGNNSFERVIWTKDGGDEEEPEPGDGIRFQGIRQNVPDRDLEGWRPCHTSRFGATTNNLQSVIDNDCRGEHVMLGCRQVGSANWNLLAQGRHAQVFRNTGGRGSNNLTRENGVDFYYNNSYSMGFVQAGTGVSRNSCDTRRDPGSAQRMCWHSSGNRMTSGYRCGNNFLNGNNGWERRIWVLDGGGEGPPDDVFFSCLHARSEGNRASGVYNLRPPGEQVRRVYCDMQTDGGGWTLVGSTEGQTLNDQRQDYYADLATLDPARANAGVWWGLRALGNRWDMRFTCRDAVRAADAPMTVDLSVYDVPYYTEFTTGSDAQSCFSESNGRGDENPPPMRRNNLNGQVRNRGDQWNAGYLEGEDSCGDTGDFTIDFDDRGMDSNQSDGTDWGEDDSSRKCGRSGLGTGQWFIFVRERLDDGPPEGGFPEGGFPEGEFPQFE